MSLPDSFYIALCMTVLLVGAIYWVWTQIQYVQRKVNVLENAMYELKTLCSRPSQTPDVHIGAVGSVASMASAAAPLPSPYPPAPSSVLGEDEDLLHEQLHREQLHEDNTATNEMPIEPFEEAVEEIAEIGTDDEMQIDETSAPFDEVPSSSMADYVKMAEEDNSSTAGSDPLAVGGIASSGLVSVNSTLDGMTIKELRRLGQQRGVPGANELKKKDLIAAIRALPVGMFDA